MPSKTIQVAANGKFFFLIEAHWPQTVKNLPAMPETWVRSMGQEDSLEKEMTTYSSIPA